MSGTTIAMQHRLTYGLGAVVLLAIALLYWPATHFNFVWSDWRSFHDMPWLTQGDEWKQAIFRGFNNWLYYFRPFVVAFFALQVRLFDSTPGPMHVVSIVLHLIDTVLVGILAWRCATLSGMNAKRRSWLTPLCMLIYGLHPALIETVAWIGCQFELMLILLAMLGLIANLGIRRAWLRAGVITLIFFLAACSKEAALSFPFLIVVFDWLLFSGGKGQRFIASIKAVLQRNWLTYAGIMGAGVGYLFFRHWALGSVTSNFHSTATSPMGHLWEICTVYLNYLQVIVWPIHDLGPLHPYIPGDFQGPLTPDALARMGAALIVAVGGLYLFLRRKSALGAMIVATTVALLPVLHIIPVEFELSLYHERYATLALAVVCGMMPLLRLPARLTSGTPDRIARPLMAIVAVFWLAFSIIDIRLVLPNWTNDSSLWSWALSMHPHAAAAKVNLLSSYAREKNYAAAREFGDRVLADPASCDQCMFQIAELAIRQGELTRATIALERVRRSPLVVRDPGMLHTYYALMGQLLAQQNKLDDAESMFRQALLLAPQDTEAKNALDTIEGLKNRAAPTRQ